MNIESFIDLAKQAKNKEMPIGAAMALCLACAVNDITRQMTVSIAQTFHHGTYVNICGTDRGLSLSWGNESGTFSSNVGLYEKNHPGVTSDVLSAITKVMAKVYNAPGFGEYLGRQAPALLSIHILDVHGTVRASFEGYSGYYQWDPTTGQEIIME